MGKLSKTRKSIKGFTLTELAIVIAVIAILVAVLVPTFIALIDKANKSSDSQLVSYINDALNTENAGGGTEQVEVEVDGTATPVYNVVDAISSLSDYGYSISNLTTKADGADIVYNATTNSFIYYTEDFTEITYGTEPSENDVLVVITDSSLSRQSAVESSSSVISGRGVNYCVYSEDSVVNLSNDSEVTVWLYTVENSTVTIDVANGTVYQYGAIKTLTVTAVASESLHVYGTVNAITMQSGHLKYEEGGEVKYVYVPDTCADYVKLTLGTSAAQVLSNADISVNGYSGTVTKIDGVEYTNADDYETAVADYSDIFTSVSEEKATCTEEGSYTYTSIFGTTVTAVIPATGHTHGTAVTENEVAATCTDNGGYDTVVYCTVCGEEVSKETITVPAIGHSYNSDKIAWADDGTTATFTCANDSSHTETVDAVLVGTYAPGATEYSVSDEYATSVYTVTYGEIKETKGIKNTDWAYTVNTTDNTTNIILTEYSGDGGAISIPDGTTEIKDGATTSGVFYSKRSSITSVTIPDSVTTIGAYAFKSCSNITEITLGSGVTTIGTYAFNGCSALASITIPERVTYIGAYAFSSCSKLTDLYISNLKNWCEINFVAYTSNPLNSSSSGSIYLNNSKITSLDFSSYDITTISAYAFYKCTSITSLKTGSNITSIGEKAFYSCTGIVSITLGSGLTSIGTYAFQTCTGLSSLTFADGINLETISEGTFNSCSSLLSVKIPDSVKEIGKAAFYGCTKLATVTLNSELETIGYSAFYNCKVLKSITIPASVTKIGYSAFESCAALETVTFEDTSGWYYTSSDTYTGGTAISSSDLTDKENAAYLLHYPNSNTYSGYAHYYWYKA